MHEDVCGILLGYRGGLGMVNAYGIDADGIGVYGICVYDGGGGLCQRRYFLWARRTVTKSHTIGE